MSALHRSKTSPLSRTVRCEGQELEIVIFDDGEGQWRLEVVNQQDVRTTWIESFKTETRALNEALKTIRENGADDFSTDLSYRNHLH